MKWCTLVEVEGLIGFKDRFGSCFLGFKDILNDILLNFFLGFIRFSKDEKTHLMNKKECFLQVLLWMMLREKVNMQDFEVDSRRSYSVDQMEIMKKIRGRL